MKTISRRTLLRGAGAAVALPWLEAMVPATAWAAGSGRPPVRLAWFYVPNGVHMAAWRPKPLVPSEGSKGVRVEGVEELKELPPILKSLEPVRKNILVVSDL